MPRYRKKPIEVEARNWDGTTEGALLIIEWVTSHGGAIASAFRPEFQGRHTLAVKTLEGRMHAAPGWWIIRGVVGEFYPCDPEVFAATYEVVE